MEKLRASKKFKLIGGEGGIGKIVPLKKKVKEKLSTVDTNLLTSFTNPITESAATFLRSISYKRAVIQLDTRRSMSQYFSAMRLLSEISPYKFRKFQDLMLDNNLLSLEEEISYHGHINRANSFSVETMKIEYKDDEVFRRARIEFFGPDRFHYMKKLRDKISLGEEREGYFFLRYGWSQGNYSITRPFDSIILDDKVKFRIVRGLYRWHRQVNWYKEHHIVHKLGILLYGPPGSGKTSIIRAIISAFPNPSVLFINDNTGDLITRMLSVYQNRKTVSIFIFEELDKLISGDDQYSRKNECQRTLMQVLDGLSSFEESIIIATTNHIEKIPEELLRWGRFDIREEIPYMTKELALKFLKRFQLDEKFLEEHKDEVQEPYNPSELQALIMRDR